MSSHDRRAAGRRRAWGRGPVILRFEPLEGRQLLAAGRASARRAVPDLVTTTFAAVPNADWNDRIEAVGTIANLGKGPVPAGAFAGIYASPTVKIGPGSQLVGVVPIPEGLAPGAVLPFRQEVTMPPSPLGGMQSPKVWLGVRLDPEGAVAESKEVNNEGRGKGVDRSPVMITARRPSKLVGSSFGVSAAGAHWGESVSVTAQVSNTAQGDAPATRARVVLTPAGLVPGGPGDVTIGDLDVPALPAFQSVNIVREVELPDAPPSAFLAQGSYLVSMIQDAGHGADLAVQAPELRGLGVDSAVLAVAPAPGETIVRGDRPDLAATAVVVRNSPLLWGQAFQVDTRVENLGKADAPAFHVRFLLTGVNGSTDRSIYLGEAEVAGGLKAGFSQDVIQTLRLPSRLPHGYNVAALDYGRIVAEIDGENRLDEGLETNNGSASAPVTLFLLNSDGSTTVPSLPPVRQNVPSPTAVAAANPALTARVVVPRKRGVYKPVPGQEGNPIIHKISKYPRKFNNFLKSLSLTGGSR